MFRLSLAEKNLKRNNDLFSCPSELSQVSIRTISFPCPSCRALLNDKIFKTKEFFDENFHEALRNDASNSDKQDSSTIELSLETLLYIKNVQKFQADLKSTRRCLLESWQQKNYCIDSFCFTNHRAIFWLLQKLFTYCDQLVLMNMFEQILNDQLLTANFF